MTLLRVVVLVLVTSLVLVPHCTSGQDTTSKSCSGSICNVKCQFDNIQLLNELIDGRIRSILQLANSTGKNWCLNFFEHKLMQE